MGKFLRYKAGAAILNVVRDEGLSPARIKAFAGPAGGPKWFVSVGFDRAVMKSGLLDNGNRVLLAGSSAGAWRCLAMACVDPEAAYEALRVAYSRNTFDATDTPVSVAAAIRGNVDAFIGDEDVDFILNHPNYDIAIHTVRAKSIAASENKAGQGAALLGAVLLNAINPKYMRPFYERAVFYTGRPAPDFVSTFNGAAVRLTAANLRRAATATGSLPYIIAGVADIPGAPDGVYRDGGITDYQLNQDYASTPGMTLFFHYQERVTPGWFDKKLKWRKPAREVTADVLQVFPTEYFVKTLPNRRIPDRNDFIEYVHNPSERIRIWDEVSELSNILGEEFMNDVESKRLRDLVEPLR
jgi:hypothetical protein